MGPYGALHAPKTYLLIFKLAVPSSWYVVLANEQKRLVYWAMRMQRGPSCLALLWMYTERKLTKKRDGLGTENRCLLGEVNFVKIFSWRWNFIVVLSNHQREIFFVAWAHMELSMLLKHI